MIYTGYFAKTKKYIEAGLTPVSVAGITPGFFKGPKWGPFAPRKDTFYKWKNGEISNEAYMKLYRAHLEETISDVSLIRIKELSKNKDIVLCCYEKAGDFCHRHALAEWLGNKLGVEIKEYENEQV